MKKSTKGAVAAGAAAVLLMGGAGTLAYWTATDTVDGGDIASGNLALSDLTCGDWAYADAEGTGTVTKLVPGDTITKECSAEVTGEGDHLFADIAVDATSVTDVETAFGTDKLTVTATPTGTGDHIAISSTPTTVSFTLNVAFPYTSTSSVAVAGANNDSQNGTAALDGLKVTVKQVHD